MSVLYEASRAMFGSVKLEALLPLSPICPCAFSKRMMFRSCSVKTVFDCCATAGIADEKRRQARLVLGQSVAGKSLNLRSRF